MFSPYFLKAFPQLKQIKDVHTHNITSMYLDFFGGSYSNKFKSILILSTIEFNGISRCCKN